MPNNHEPISIKARTRLNTWQAKFIASLRMYGVVAVAIRAAKINRTTLYDHRHKDANFAAKWADALEDAADALESEARRRAERGTLRPVFQRGEKVGSVREYSDTLMLAMLKAARPEKFRDNAKVEHVGANNGPIRTEVNHKFDHARYASIFDRVAGVRTGGDAAGPPTTNGN